MVFWQLTIDANDPARLASFWAQSLGYLSTPPAEAEATWWTHYRERLGDEAAFDDRLFSPDGSGPALWFQEVPEGKAGKNRLHLDLYATGRDGDLPFGRRVEIVDAKVDQVVALGARVVERFRDDDPEDAYYFVVMQDPEGNEFCVA
jgi:hypothetical protein